MIRAPVLLAAMIAAVLATCGTVQAQDEVPTVVPIVLRPASAPVPALKYRLLPERNTLIPGNAAIFYHRAVERILQEQSRRDAAKEKDQQLGSDGRAVYDWINGQIAAIPLDQAHGWLDRYRSALHEAELGARRQSCDWEFDSRPEGFDLMIEEIQHLRTLAPLIALQVRVAVRDGKPDVAIDWLQTGFALGRHVSDGPLLIQSLVGVSFNAMLIKPLEDLIQAPAMPSLYWALATRTRPAIDLAPALEGERFQLERELPRFRELDGLPWSVAETQAFTEEVQTKLYRMIRPGAPESTTSGTSIGGWSSRMGVAALIAQAYPEAKRTLIAQGRSPKLVESMPTAQVTLLHTYQGYQQYRDDVYKWSGLPYYQAYKGLQESWMSHISELRGRVLLRLFTSLLGSTRGAAMVSARLDRQLDALQCIEAIRISAQVHHKLPDRLDAIAEAPVPFDPMTGQPFGYRVDGDHATLTAPMAPGAPPVAMYAIHYDLKLTPVAGK